MGATAAKMRPAHLTDDSVAGHATHDVMGSGLAKAHPDVAPHDMTREQLLQEVLFWRKNPWSPSPQSVTSSMSTSQGVTSSATTSSLGDLERIPSFGGRAATPQSQPQSPMPTEPPTAPCPGDYPQVKTIDEFEAMVRGMYSKNLCGFADKYNDAVAAVTPRPQGTADSVWEDWKDKGIDFLCAFFRDWHTWYPTFNKGDGLEYIQKFTWLYFQSNVGLSFVTTYPGTEVTKQFVVLRGMWMDSKESIPLANLWMEQMGEAGMSQYVVPEGGYQSFNEFFKRPLKNPRPVSKEGDASMCVTPADAIVNMVDNKLTLDGKSIQTKTQYMSLRNLLNDSEFSPKFVGGTALSCILMPDVYHRYHSPIQGEVVEADEDVAGNFFGNLDFPAFINNGNVGYGSDYSVFEHYRHGYLIIKTEGYGYVAMIPVGLETISTVIFEEKFKKVSKNDKPVPIAKGEEVGYFQYGGSLCILLFQKGVFPSVRVPQGSLVGQLLPPVASCPAKRDGAGDPRAAPLTHGEVGIKIDK